MKMKRSEITMPEYFDRYINKCDDVTVLESLEVGLKEWQDAPVDLWKQIGDKVYAPGKWTIKDILQHLIDTERIFTYRALSFARGEENVMPFDEDLFAKNANANVRSLESLIKESVYVRQSTISMYNSFDNNMMQKKGKSFKGEYCVNAIGFIFGGHQRWHFDIINERYSALV